MEDDTDRWGREERRSLTDGALPSVSEREWQCGWAWATGPAGKRERAREGDWADVEQAGWARERRMEMRGFFLFFFFIFVNSFQSQIRSFLKQINFGKLFNINKF